MSRIGKLPITLPANVQIEVSNDNNVTVKGPKGTLVVPVDRDINVATEDGQLVVTRPTEQKRHKAMVRYYFEAVLPALRRICSPTKRTPLPL